MAEKNQIANPSVRELPKNEIEPPENNPIILTVANEAVDNEYTKNSEEFDQQAEIE